MRTTLCARTAAKEVLAPPGSRWLSGIATRRHLSSRRAAAIIASADQEPAPLRIILGSQALQITVGVLKDRLASFEAQGGLAASTDFPPGK